MSPALRLVVVAAALLCVVLAGRGGIGGSPTSAAVPQGFAERWQLGVRSETPLLAGALRGRPLGLAPVARLDADGEELFFIFPPTEWGGVVRAASVAVLSRAGTSSAAATVALEVRGHDGALRRTLSAAPFDLLGAASGSWTSVALVADEGARTLAADEYLAFHIVLVAGAGDLDVRPAFEVLVGTDAAESPTATATTTATPTEHALFVPWTGR